MTSRVLQGSILGPIQSIIYIKDLPDCEFSTCKIFAGNTKLCIFSLKSSVLQNDLNSLQCGPDLRQL